MKDLGITKGEWIIRRAVVPDQNSEIVTVGVGEEIGLHYKATAILGHESKSEVQHNATLITDAGNTAQKCGLLPSELLKQRDEYKNMIRSLILSIAAHPDYLNGEEGDEWHDLVSLADELMNLFER